MSRIELVIGRSFPELHSSATPLLRQRVKTEAEYKTWCNQNLHWTLETQGVLETRFTRSDRLRFTNTGLFEPFEIFAAGTFSGKHKKHLNHLMVRTERLSEIIDKYSKALLT